MTPGAISAPSPLYTALLWSLWWLNTLEKADKGTDTPSPISIPIWAPVWSIEVGSGQGYETKDACRKRHMENWSFQVCTLAVTPIPAARFYFLSIVYIRLTSLTIPDQQAWLLHGHWTRSLPSAHRLLVFANMQFLLRIVTLLSAASVGTATSVVRRDCSFKWVAEKGNTCLSSMYLTFSLLYSVYGRIFLVVSWSDNPGVLSNLISKDW